MYMYKTYKKGGIHRPFLTASIQSLCATISGYGYYNCVMNHGTIGFVISCLHHTCFNLFNVFMMKISIV